MYLIITSDVTCPIAPLRNAGPTARLGPLAPLGPIQGNRLGTAELWMTVSTKRSLTATPAPTASPLAVSFQTPELDLQVAIGQLLRQETEQRTEQPCLFQ